MVTPCISCTCLPQLVAQQRQVLGHALVRVVHRRLLLRMSRARIRGFKWKQRKRALVSRPARFEMGAPVSGTLQLVVRID